LSVAGTASSDFVLTSACGSLRADHQAGTRRLQ
jgi:hypothetical protein